MKLKPYLMLALLWAVAQGLWAQWARVDNELELKQALADGQRNIKLDYDIQLSGYLDIDGKTSTIDLNGHKLSRNLSSSSDAGHVIWVHNNSNLTIADNSDTHSGSIEGGKATNGGGINVWPGCTLTVTGGTFKNNSASDNGGAIFVRNGATATISNASFIGNFAADHAGAIWNNGTLSVTDCTFTGNTAKDVGGIYNSVTETDGITYAGTATLTRCTFTGNKGTAGAGALANAMGDTEMTIEDCTIQDNTAYEYGAGIWNGGTLNMKGKITVTDNTNTDDEDSNVFLKTGQVITLTGSLTGSSIGVTLEGSTGTFTKGYNTYHSTAEPFTIFTADHSIELIVSLAGNEACLITGSIFYIERSWDETNKKVVNIEKSLFGSQLAYGDTPEYEEQYKKVTNAPANTPNEWFGMGGYSSNFAEYYVVLGKVYRETIVVQGKNVHLILCDGATLTLTGGLRLEGDNKLYIHCQSYGDRMGKLIVTNKYNIAAGIGSARYDEILRKVGELVIYGGHIETTGGSGGAGIGSGGKLHYSDDNQLCKSVIVYGGYVQAKGGENAAGIGGGSGGPGPGIAGGNFILYDGNVIATGGDSPDYNDINNFGGGAGIGGGGTSERNPRGGYGGNVTVYGGTLTATGSLGAAGIGSAHLSDDKEKRQLCGGTFNIYGGTVIAESSLAGAGIGGGFNSGGAEVNVYGGTVTAKGGYQGAGIGGGNNGIGGNVTITGGTVTATGGGGAAGIGGSIGGNGGNVTISGGTVTAEGGGSGAGIGGGYIGDGGNVTISGGNVTATGGEKGAGIGSGYISYDTQLHGGGTVTITGGNVTATGGEKSAGIGGGYDGCGGDVTITGGIVKAKAGNQGGEGNRAIGPGKGNDKYGTLVIGDIFMVGAGNNGSVESIVDADERVNACWFRTYAEISLCTHPGATYTIEGTDGSGTHTWHCSHCATQFKTEPHDFDKNGECKVCHFKGTVNTVTIYLPDANDDDTYEEDGRYKTYSYDMVAGTTFTLPGAPQDLYDMEFAGWLVTTGTVSSSSSYRTYPGEMLLPEKTEYTLERDVNFVARYKDIAIYLADNSDNGEKLYNYDGKKATSVTLAGRTLYKDGGWNTLCLPFSLTEAEIAASLLAGADIRTLWSSSFDESDGTLTLTFTAKDEVTSITAGTPYIVKWEPTTPNTVSNLILNNVIISNATSPVETKYVNFVGTYSPIDIFTEEKTNLYLGANDKLYYPSGEGMTSFPINSFRAYFQLKGGLSAGELSTTEGQEGQNIKAFVLNFGEETGIDEVNGYGLWVNGYGAGWCTLDGRRIIGTPTAQGVYIYNGRKVMIK